MKALSALLISPFGSGTSMIIRSIKSSTPKPDFALTLNISF